MLRTLKQAYRSERPLDVRAFVVADRDYALDETYEAEQARYLRAPYAAEQTWRIWERVEIENYLLDPMAIAQVVIGAHSQTPLLRPAPEDVTDLVEQLVEASRERVRLRLIDVFSDRSRSRSSDGKLPPSLSAPKRSWLRFGKAKGATRGAMQRNPCCPAYVSSSDSATRFN